MLLRRLWVALKTDVVAVKAPLSLEVSLETASSPGFLVATPAPRPTFSPLKRPHSHKSSAQIRQKSFFATQICF